MRCLFKKRSTNGLVLLSLASILNQAIVFISAPILSRIFSADDFGRLAVFTSYVNIIGSVSTGLYENVILIHENDDSAWSVFMTASLLGIGYSILSTAIMLLVHFAGGMNYFSYTEIFLLGLNVCLSALYTCINYWFNRLGHFSFFIRSMILQTGINVVVSISLRLLFGVENALIISVVIGAFVATLFLGVSVFRKFSFQGFFSRERIWNDMLIHKSFPLYQAPTNLITMIQTSLVPVIFSNLFGMTFAGYFSMANRIVRVPFTLFTSAISNIFKNEFREALIRRDEVRIFIKYAKILILLSVIVFPILGFLGPSIFSFWLGDAWEYAGSIAKVICFMLLFEFVDLPLRSVFMNYNKQRLIFLFQLTSIIVSFSTIYLTNYFYSDAEVSLKSFALVSSVISVFAIMISYKIVKKKNISHV